MFAARTLAYAVAGVSWLMVDFVTWRTHGTLASSSLADVVRLARAHEAHVSPGNVMAITAVPVLGAALGALCAWRNRLVAWVRIAVAAGGVCTAIALIAGLGKGEGSAFGPGAWLAMAGVVAAATGVVIDGFFLVIRRRPIESAS
ncbi:hypothetical protein Back2_15220 [Nocardioides baekrokdamisoli]|uniref:Uncharacterized protein n=1 Tax=Nocardioides baekrokdamisoli TaxID=1804624 RepID=A0A3G9IMK1_9ACTN|nr:hypothetical protein [Nocardioides baekrokdamisoli]BBH17235.1 hypothetical protein Back2_15220 [Nocardioides baekrokdamisoli]